MFPIVSKRKDVIKFIFRDRGYPVRLPLPPDTLHGCRARTLRKRCGNVARIVVPRSEKRVLGTHAVVDDAPWWEKSAFAVVVVVAVTMRERCGNVSPERLCHVRRNGYQEPKRNLLSPSVPTKYTHDNDVYDMITTTTIRVVPIKRYGGYVVTRLELQDTRGTCGAAIAVAVLRIHRLRPVEFVGPYISISKCLPENQNYAVNYRSIRKCNRTGPFLIRGTRTGFKGGTGLKHENLEPTVDSNI